MQDLINFIEHIENNEWEQKSLDLNSGRLTQLETPGALHFLPKENVSSQKLALSCGVHGNETAPIEILWDILESIKSHNLMPNIEVLFLFGHTKAMLEHKRFIDFNLNRLFSENYKNYPDAQESKRAHELESVMYTFFDAPSFEHWHLDLHTAIRGSHHERFAVRPYYQDNRAVSQNELNLCSALGVQAILKTVSAATTFAGFSATKINAQSFTVELGKVAPFGKNDLQKFESAKKTLIKILAQGSLHLTESTDAPIVYDVKKELINDHDNYEFFIGSDYLNFSPLEEGQEIERNEKGILCAQKGQSIVFPNPHVPIGQRTGLLVQAQ